MWHEEKKLGLDVLRAIHDPLFKSAASLDRQLAALRQRCGSGAGSNFPTAAQLQAAWAVLVTALALAWARRGIPRAEFAALEDQAAHTLFALQPDNPRSSYELGNAAAFSSTAGGPASRRRDALPHLQRGAELARAQGNDFWLARCAGGELWSSRVGCRVQAEAPS